MKAMTATLPLLKDPFGRSIEYVRLSVTDRCNLRCFYCLPKDFHAFQPRDECLSYEEIERLIGAFARLGVHRIRLTGGEPLVRRESGRSCAMKARNAARTGWPV